jgi:hypothetical protein
VFEVAKAREEGNNKLCKFDIFDEPRIFSKRALSITTSQEPQPYFLEYEVR